jgi:hypothetical protein
VKEFSARIQKVGGGRDFWDAVNTDTENASAEGTFLEYGEESARYEEAGYQMDGVVAELVDED